MIYNLKRAMWVSALLYLTTFIVGIVTGIVSGQDMSSMETISDSFWYIGMISSVILAKLFALLYFKKAIMPSWMSGLYFGLTAVAVSFVFDVVFFSIGNSQGAGVDVWEYYSDFRFWIIIALVVATTTAVGAWKARK